jgi:hypothetical protein
MSSGELLPLPEGMIKGAEGATFAHRVAPEN